MLYAVVSNGMVGYIGTDHGEAQKEFDAFSKEQGKQFDVHLVQVQADVIQQTAKEKPADKAGAPQLSPQELQQLKALLAKADAQQKGTGK